MSSRRCGCGCATRRADLPGWGGQLFGIWDVDLCQLSARKSAERAHLELSQGEGADADPAQLANRQFELGTHVTNLAAAAFRQDDPQGCGAGQARLGKRGDVGSAGAIAVDHHGFSQGLQLLRGYRSIDGDIVGLGVSMAGMGQLLGQGTVIGQQQESFAVFIETADGKESFGNLAFQQGKHGLSLVFTGAADQARRLMEHVGDMFVRAVNRLALHRDLVGSRVDGRSQCRHRYAIDLHTALPDEILGLAAGRPAGLGQEFLQAYAGCISNHGIWFHQVARTKRCRFLFHGG